MKAEPEASPNTFDDAVVVALGSNLRTAALDCVGVLKAALAALPLQGVEPVRVSRFWRSAAWPDALQPPYVNAVALVRTDLDAAALLSALHAVERDFARRRGEPNAPRTLDLDLIAYGRLVQAGPPTLPHPRAAERLFVMGPLAEIAPDWRHPVSGERASDLAARAVAGCDAAPVPPLGTAEI